MSLLCMKDICKSFNGIPVLKQVQLTIEKGEVHALLGENGAGKSTLMNILAGVFPADSGEVEFNEKKIRKMTIQQSEKLGIAFVHQELNLFNDLKVYENIFLMKEYKKKTGILDKKRMIRETQQLFTELGVEIEPEEPYSDEYNEVVDRFKNERDNHILPALRTKVENMDDYDTLIIGSPIWGGLLSSPVKSFLSGYDLSGKKILPFCTHGGSGTAQSVDNIRKLCPHAEILLFMAVKLQTLGMK